MSRFEDFPYYGSTCVKVEPVTVPDGVPIRHQHGLLSLGFVLLEDLARFLDLPNCNFARHFVPPSVAVDNDLDGVEEGKARE